MEVESKVCAFTWTNNGDWDALVKNRLRRVICNFEQGAFCPNAEVFAPPAIGSDYSPIRISVNTPLGQMKKRV